MNTFQWLEIFHQYQRNARGQNALHHLPVTFGKGPPRRWRHVPRAAKKTARRPLDVQGDYNNLFKIVFEGVFNIAGNRHDFHKLGHRELRKTQRKKVLCM